MRAKIDDLLLMHAKNPENSTRRQQRQVHKRAKAAVADQDVVERRVDGAEEGAPLLLAHLGLLLLWQPFVRGEQRISPSLRPSPRVSIIRRRSDPETTRQIQLETNMNYRCVLGVASLAVLISDFFLTKILF